MTEEKLNLAKELLKKIEEQEKILENSNFMPKFIAFYDDGDYYPCCNDKDLIEVIKTLIIAANEKKLKDLKQEFDNL
jgi:hypothetical protein